MSERTTGSIELLLRREGADDEYAFVTSAVDTMRIDMRGITAAPGIDDKHREHFVRAGVRDNGFRRKGPEEGRAVKFNTRQISVIDTVSLDIIGDRMEIDPQVIDDEYGISRMHFIASRIGANLVVSGLETPDGRTADLNSERPPYYLGEFDSEGLFTTSVLVLAYNEPCVNPGKSLAAAYPGSTERWGQRFMEAARAERGYVGVTGTEGELATGAQVMIEPLPTVPEGER